MCQRTICQDCSKFTWTGCGQHIAQVLAGLPLEQICSCDDDQDSEHSWTTVTDLALATGTGASRPIPRYPRPFPFTTASSSSSSSAVNPSLHPTVAATSIHVSASQPGEEKKEEEQVPDASVGESTTATSGNAPHCIDPSPVEYKLSKISSTSATVAAVRMAQQAAALEELRKIKEKKDQEMRNANEHALGRLLQGLSDAVDTPPSKEDAQENSR